MCLPQILRYPGGGGGIVEGITNVLLCGMPMFGDGAARRMVYAKTLFEGELGMVAMRRENSYYRVKNDAVKESEGNDIRMRFHPDNGNG
jgi:hypothetical protein